MLLAQDPRLARRVGALTLLAMAAVSAGLVFLLDRGGLGPTIRFRVMFHHTAGLHDRAPLIVAGRQVGRIAAITPVPHGAPGPLAGEVGVAVTVELARDERWKVPAAASVFVASRGPLSDRYLEVAPPANGKRLLRIRPGVSHVHHEHEIRSDGLPAGGNHFDNSFVGFLKRVVTVGTVDANFKFGGGKTHGLSATQFVQQRSAILRQRAARRQQRSIGFNAVLHGAAEQFVNRNAQRLAFDIPERHVDGAHRADERAPASRHF